MSSLTVWLLSMTRGIRRRRNAAELARIEPVHAATLAGVDDDIARSAIHLVDHGLAARRTLQVSLARRLAARWQGLNRPRFVKPRGVDHRSKPAHLDQHPEAPRAAEQRHGVHPTFCQRRRAERAPPVRRLEQFYVLESGGQLLLGAAVVARQASLCHSHRRPAIRAVRHRAIIAALRRNEDLDGAGKRASSRDVSRRPAAFEPAARAALPPRRGRRASTLGRDQRTIRLIRPPDRIRARSSRTS